MPEVDAAIPPGEWPLSEQGRAAAARLVLPRGVRILSSAERKAVETAEAIGGEIVVDARVNEVRRPRVWGEDFREQARAYVGGTRHAGWEAHAEVTARFDATWSGDSHRAASSEANRAGRSPGLTNIRSLRTSVRVC